MDLPSQANLLNAAVNGDREGVLEALEEGASVDSADHVNQTALMHADRNNFLSVAQLLLERRAKTEVAIDDK